MDAGQKTEDAIEGGTSGRVVTGRFYRLTKGKRSSSGRQAADEEAHSVAVRIDGHMYRTRIGAFVNAEVAWARDSNAFFVTYSDGGSVGAYHVRVDCATNRGLHVVEPVPNDRRLFAPRCFDPERPNVGAIGWAGDTSDQLAITVQVPPHSSCASMGTFKAFVIRLPSGAIPEPTSPTAESML